MTTIITTIVLSTLLISGWVALLVSEEKAHRAAPKAIRVENDPRRR